MNSDKFSDLLGSAGGIGHLCCLVFPSDSAPPQGLAAAQEHLMMSINRCSREKREKKGFVSSLSGSSLRTDGRTDEVCAPLCPSCVSGNTFQGTC